MVRKFNPPKDINPPKTPEQIQLIRERVFEDFAIAGKITYGKVGGISDVDNRKKFTSGTFRDCLRVYEDHGKSFSDFPERAAEIVEEYWKGNGEAFATAMAEQGGMLLESERVEKENRAAEVAAAQQAALDEPVTPKRGRRRR